jgi:hypothetical protein
MRKREIELFFVLVSEIVKYRKRRFHSPPVSSNAKRPFIHSSMSLTNTLYSIMEIDEIRDQAGYIPPSQ